MWLGEIASVPQVGVDDKTACAGAFSAVIVCLAAKTIACWQRRGGPVANLAGCIQRQAAQ